MINIKTSSDRPAPWQAVLLAAVSFVLVLIMSGQDLVQAASLATAASHPSDVPGAAGAPLEHDHHGSHGHDGSVQADAGSDTMADKTAHHAGHADGGGCCPASVCGSACSGVCSGSGVGVSVTTAAVPRLAGMSLTVGAMTEDPLLARALGVPFRPPDLG